MANIISDFGELPHIKQRLEINKNYKNNIALLEIESEKTEAIVIYAIDKEIDNQKYYNYSKAFISRLSESTSKITGERYIVAQNPIRVAMELLIQINNSDNFDNKIVEKKAQEANSKKIKDFDLNNTDPDYIFNDIMLNSIQMGATDVHISVREQSGAVLFRLHGLLRRWRRYPPDLLYKAAAYAYNTLKLEGTQSHPHFDANRMQSAMIALKETTGYDINLRWQSTYTVGGFDVVVRLLKNTLDRKVLTLEQLGYTPWQQQQLMLSCSKTSGGVLIAGVTGSGKTTTLNTLVQIAPNMHLKKTISIEDPVEYRQRTVSQISIQRKIEGEGDGKENPFSGAMRAILRMDPDSVIFGEIRDKESGNVAQAMIETGHLVYATVHASSAVSIVPRLTSKLIALERDTISSEDFISILIYQKLVPKNCPHCSIPILNKEANASKEQLNLLENKFGLDLEQIKVASARGCSKCQLPGMNSDENEKMGIIGATVTAEMIVPDYDFLNLVRDAKDNEAKLSWRRTRTHSFSEDNMQGKTSFEHALYKVAHGEIDPYFLEDSFESMQTYNIIGDINSGNA